MAETKEKISQIDRGSMRRVLGVFDVFAIGYGDMGSSIYYALGITAFFALGATPLALLTAGGVFICTALTYAEMTSIFLEAGGSATFGNVIIDEYIIAKQEYLHWSGLQITDPGDTIQVLSNGTNLSITISGAEAV